MNLDQYLSDAAAAKRKATAKMMDEIYDDLKPYYLKKEMPWFVVPKIQELGVNGVHIKDFGGPGLTNGEVGSILYEMAKKDASVCTFFLVHNLIGQNVVDALGDDEQRQRILSETINMQKIMCFCLTEPDYGSDATSLKTVATKTKGGYIINGEKRWPGNATFADYHVVWARNPEENNNI
jgi:acyl-CoA oxidase